MDFTYNISSSDTSIAAVSKIRLEIGDTLQDKGALPDGSNFSDDELLYFYTNEGESLGRATAKACEVLTTHWANAIKTMFGSLVDPSRVSYNYRKQSEKLRGQFGYYEGANAGFSIPMKQVVADE